MNEIRDEKIKRLVDDELGRERIKKCPKCDNKVEYHVKKPESESIHSIHHYEPIGVERSGCYISYYCLHCNKYLMDADLITPHEIEIFDKYKDEEVPLPPHLEESRKNIKNAINNTTEEKDGG